MRNKSNVLLDTNKDNSNKEHEREGVFIDNEDELKDLEINHTELRKSSRWALPKRKIVILVIPSNDILSDDFDPK